MASSRILALGLAMMGLAFLSSYMYKSTYTIVHGYNLHPPKLRNVAYCQIPLALNEGCGKKDGNASLIFASIKKNQKTNKKRAPSPLTFFLSWPS
jgi:hypothetical protein